MSALPFDGATEFDAALEERMLAAEQHRGALLRVARRHAATLEDAQDAVSEAVLRAGLKLDLDSDQALPWLVTVTKNICIDQHRLRASQRQVGVRAETRAGVDAAPDDEVCERAEASWAARLVRRLPERQQAVLELRAAGLSVPEIAEELGLSYKAVESLTSRARTHLRSAMSAAYVRLAALALVVKKFFNEHRAASEITAVATALAIAMVAPSIGSSAESDLAAAPRRVVRDVVHDSRVIERVAPDRDALLTAQFDQDAAALLQQPPSDVADPNCATVDGHIGVCEGAQPDGSYTQLGPSEIPDNLEVYVFAVPCEEYAFEPVARCVPPH